MTELFSKEELFDVPLTRGIGPADPGVSDAIVDICNDAVEQVLGPTLAETLEGQRERLPFVVPWIWDLARGLHFQSKFSQPVQLSTDQLLSALGDRAGDPRQRQRFAEAIDLATVLTLDRLMEPVLGPGCCGRPQHENEASVPWLIPLKLGYRIHLALECLRLTPN